MPDASPSVSARTKKALFILLAVALVIHVASDVGVYLKRPESISTTPDPLDYRLLALNLLEHHTFSIAPASFQVHEMLRTPVYPALLAGTYLLDGGSGLAMILLQSLMLIVMGWLLFWLMMAFRVPDTLALVLTGVYLFEPFQWLYTLHTMTETLASLLMLALLAGALVGKGITDWSRAALYGIGLGLLVFEKPSAMMWVPFLLALVLVAAGSWRARFARAGLALFLCLLTLAPWMIRNHALAGSFTVSSSGPYNLVYMFQGRSSDIPPSYTEALTTVSYNGRSNQVWYAYTTAGYPMLVRTEHAILSHLDLVSFVSRQLAYAPVVWFGYIHPRDQEASGHEYALIADLATSPNAGRDAVIGAVDTGIWALALALGLLGSFLFLRDASLRWRFLPLLAMLVATICINLCAAWVRVLLPVYPVIFVAVGAGVAYILRRAHRMAV